MARTVTKKKVVRAKTQDQGERKAAKLAREIIAIADNPAGDYIKRTNTKGESQVLPDKENIARAKLRIDVRMWLMSRLAPHIYGAPAGAKNPDMEPMSFNIGLTPQPDDES